MSCFSSNACPERKPGVLLQDARKSIRSYQKKNERIEPCDGCLCPSTRRLSLKSHHPGDVTCCESRVRVDHERTANPPGCNTETVPCRLDVAHVCTCLPPSSNDVWYDFIKIFHYLRRKSCMYVIGIPGTTRYNLAKIVRDPHYSGFFLGQAISPV